MISKKRHLAKALTWRAIATCTTTFLAWFVTGDVKLAAEVGVLDVGLKFLLYYLHERPWYRSKFGVTTGSTAKHLSE